MDVKDINSVASFQNLIGKNFAGAVAGQIIGGGFAELIGQTTDAVLADAFVDAGGGKVKVSEADGGKREVADKSEVAKKDRKPKKEAVATKEDGAKVKGRKASVDRENADTAVAVTQDVAQPCIEKKASSGEAGVVAVNAPEAKQIVALPEAAPHAVDVDLLGAEWGKETLVAVLPEENAVVVAPQFDMNDLSTLSSVNVFDVASGEVVQMEGSELLDFVERASFQNNLYVAEDVVEGQMPQVMPAELVDIEERDFSYKLNADSNAELLGEKVVADADLLEQARVLDVKLGKEHKVSVEVSVDEENFSYTDASDLVQDSVMLKELLEVQSDAKPVEGRVSSSNLGSVQVAESVNVQTEQVQNPFAATMAVANIEAQSSVEVAKNMTVEGVSSSGGSLSGSSLGGSVAAQGEAHSAQGSDKTTFRDVFKGMSKDVVEQVKVNITKSAVKGVDHIDIKLKPEELGNIEIKMQISKDGKLQAQIVASRPETVEILQKEIQVLEKAFSDAGFEIEEGALSFSFREGGESNRKQENDSGLRNFIGSVLENENVEDIVGNDNQVWSSAQGLNIRV